jgi:hypothetical protein
MVLTVNRETTSLTALTGWNLQRKRNVFPVRYGLIYYILYITNPQLSEENFKAKAKMVAGPRWAPDTKTDWPTDCRS